MGTALLVPSSGQTEADAQQELEELIELLGEPTDEEKELRAKHGGNRTR
jgi:predicted RNase H-like HicB family nuclease